MYGMIGDEKHMTIYDILKDSAYKTEQFADTAIAKLNEKIVVREDKNGKFVLVLEQKPSPLGSRYYAVRKSVEVIASDEHRSAVTGEVTAYEYIITTSTKPIAEGQQVRLKDE